MTGMGLPARRVAIYYRVSGKEQLQGYSLDAQLRALEAWSVQHGHEIVARYPEPARSARKEDERARPAFNQMLQDAEAKRFDVVVVHKLDRFARNRRVAFDAFHRLGKAGVGFVSVSENLDYSTPAGQLMLTMLVGMAQFYSDNLAFETKKGKAERKAQGLYNGLLPFGTTKGPDGVPVLDTEARWCSVATKEKVIPAEGLQLMFELAAAGKSDREVAKALNAAGHLTAGNRGQNPLSKDTVRVILQNRFYLGELPDANGSGIPGRHGELIDATLFMRTQAQRAANTDRPRWTETKRSPWALSGTAVCGSCGRPITVMSHTSGKRRIRCSGRTQGNGCDEPSCFASVVEDQIGELLRSFEVEREERDRLLTAWRHFRGRNANAAGTRAGLERKLGRLKDLYLEGDIDKSTYQVQKAEITAELATLPAEGTETDHAAGERLATFLADVSRAWAIAAPEERNRLARQLFSSVIVTNRTAVAVVPRPELRSFFITVAVNPDGKVCTGGSDGGRSSSFRTSWLPERRSASWFPTSGQRPRSSRARRPARGLTAHFHTATTLDLAN
jgi:site-specific DNA recombinase